MDIVEAEMSGGTQKTDAGGRDVNYYFSLSLFLLAGFGKVNESIFFTKQIKRVHGPAGMQRFFGLIQFLVSKAL